MSRDVKEMLREVAGDLPRTAPFADIERRARHQQRVLQVAGVLAIVLVVGAASLLGLDLRREPAPVVGEPGIGTVPTGVPTQRDDRPVATVLAEIEVGAYPEFLEEFAGQVWVGDHGGRGIAPALHRIDPVTGLAQRFEQPTLTDHYICSLHGGDGSLLVLTTCPHVDSDSVHPMVAVVDPASGTVTEIASGPGFDVGALAIEGQVWAAVAEVGDAPARLVRIEPATRTVTDVDLGEPVEVRGATVAFGSLWLTSHARLDAGSTARAGRVLRIDPSTGEVVARIDVGDPAERIATATGSGAEGPGSVTATDGAVWVALDDEGRVARIDPATDTVVAHVDVTTTRGEHGPLLYGDGDTLWVRAPSTEVARIDAGTGAEVARVRVPRGEFEGDLVVTGGSLWLALQDVQGKVVRAALP